MTTIIAYLIAGLCVIAFITLWFAISYRKLAYKQQETKAMAEQMEMHYSIFRQERGSPNVLAAKRMLDTSRMLYRKSVISYNSMYTKSIYRFPGFIMGFRLMREKEK